MYRLTDDLAQTRMHYPSPIAGVPHAVLLELPPSMRGSGLLLGRYYIILLETDAEVRELEVFLAAPRVGPVRPSLLDERPSSMRSDGLLVFRYAPPQPGWPWLSVCRWPDKLVPIIAREVTTARGCYSFEAFQDADGLDGHAGELLASLHRRVPVAVRFVGADQLGDGGNA